MSGRRYSPKRRLRSEVLPLVAVMSLPLALYLAFPSGAFGFMPSTPSRDESVYSAFVVLGEDREARLLASARASWQSDSASRRGHRANLLSCGDRSEVVRIASGLDPVVGRAECPVPDYEVDLVPSGGAAAAPQTLDKDELPPPEPVFGRSDLLKLN